MQVVHAAIRNFRVDTRDLETGLGTVGRPEFLTTQVALCLGQPGGVFGSMPRITDSMPIAGDEQVFQAQVDANGLATGRQRLRFKLAQAGHEIASGPIFGNGDGARLARQAAAPTHRQRFLALGEVELAIAVVETATGELGCLAMVFALECRVAGAALEEVLERRLLMPKALLQRYTRHLIEPGEFLGFLQLGQVGAGTAVADFLLALSVGLGPEVENLVVDESNAAKCLRQEFLLGLGGIEAIFVGALCHGQKHNVSFTPDKGDFSTMPSLPS